MKKSDRYICRKVLQTELSVAADCLQRMDYGQARKLILQVLERVKEYDLPGGKNEAAPPA